jgi:hypothetical protein
MSSLIFPICLAASSVERPPASDVRLAALAVIRYKSQRRRADPARFGVILSEAKALGGASQMLRCAQRDSCRLRTLSTGLPMLRRTVLAAIASLFWFGISKSSGAEQTSSALGTAASTTLKKTLEAGLRARRPQEFAFLALVAAKVDEGTLPRSLVESTFFWARRQGRYPFVYFEAGLRVRAKRIGVVL